MEHGAISFLKKIVTEYSVNDNVCENDLDIAIFSELISNPVDLGNISQTDVEILTYIVGYCAFKIKSKCTASIDFCILDKELEVETSDSNNSVYAYLNIINRGGLMYPTVSVVLVISVSFLLFPGLITEKYEKHFVHVKTKQHSILSKISFVYLQTNDVACVNNRCPEYDCSYELLIMHIIEFFF